MTNSNFKLSVFTKPWKELSVWNLGKKISHLGFDGIEFPLRLGYQLEPKDAEKGLPILVNQFAEHGLSIFSVAGETNEATFAGCASAGIPIIRIMPTITHKEGYMESEKREREQLEKLLPLCEKYNVKIGVQQHYGNNVIDSMGLLRFVEDYDPNYIGAIWDSAHDALAGQQPEFGLDIVWSHLCMVNLKNAYYYRSNGPEAEEAQWGRHFTLGRHGLASWPRIAAFLKAKNYHGVLCMTAEYSDEDRVEYLIQKDIDYVKKLFRESHSIGGDYSDFEK